MIVQPPQAHNHKNDNNGNDWYFRFDDDYEMNYKYISSIYKWEANFKACYILRQLAPLSIGAVHWSNLIFFPHSKQQQRQTFLSFTVRILSPSRFQDCQWKKICSFLSNPCRRMMSGNWSSNRQLNRAAVTRFQRGSSMHVFSPSYTNTFSTQIPSDWIHLWGVKNALVTPLLKKVGLALVFFQWVTCYSSLKLLERHQLTSWVTIWTKFGLSHQAIRLIDHSTAQKKHFWRYTLILYWTWMTRKSLSLSCLTLAQHSTQIIERHLPEAQGYADDHQVYLSFRPIPSTNQTDSVTAIGKCVAELKSWMISNMLMVNDGETEFLIVGSKQQLEA